MGNFFTAFLAFIFAIAILVVFHEYGHFWAARRFGVKVLRFSVGFGKPLWKWRDKNQTEYVIAALPLGGYVKLLDEREGPVDPDQLSSAFTRKSVWARFLIVFAGPAFNFIFAILAYWITYMVGIVGWVPQVGEVIPNSIAAHAGMQVGEEIVRIDDVQTHTWQQVIKQLMIRYGDKDTLHVETKPSSGENKHYTLSLSSWELPHESTNLLHAIGIEPYQPPITPVIYEVMFGEPADTAGLVSNDLILKVNNQDIKEWKEFTDVVEKSIGKPVNLTIQRENEIKELTLVPRARENDEGEVVGFAGLRVKLEKLPEEMLRKERLGPFDAMLEAVQKTKEYTVISLRMLGKLIVGDIGLRTISGPITIAQGAGASASIGWQYYLGFLALVSISLGVINLLPIPILDGGHLMFYLIEMITRKPVSERIQLVGFKVGMLMLIFLMAIAFYNDLVRLF